MGSGRDDVRVEASPKRVRVMFAGQVLADTTGARLVWEWPHYPTYYLPVDDVHAELLVATGATESTPGRGEAAVHDVAAGGRTAQGAALRYDSSPVVGLQGTVRIEFDAMDAWFEEDEQIYVHPRDPYTRVDVLQSSRHVAIEVDGTTVAETDQPRLLFETGLPTRHYVPKTDVAMELLRPTEHRTRCPYKGTAEYYDLTFGDRVHENLAWWYRHPTHEAAGIAGYVCFYDEKVDVVVDGVRNERPDTHFV